MFAVSDTSGSPRQAKTQDQDARRTSRPPRTAVRNLSPLWVRVFSRLYEQLALTTCGLSPHVQEAIVHLAIWMPFEQVGKQLKRFLGVTTHEIRV